MLQSTWSEACFEYHCVHGHYPLRDLSNVAFRVHLVELEDLGDCIYRKHGDYRVGGTLIEDDGCTSLKEVWKSVCARNLDIPDYRNFLVALNGNLWSDFKQYVNWDMFDCKDGSWGNEQHNFKHTRTQTTSDMEAGSENVSNTEAALSRTRAPMGESGGGSKGGMKSEAPVKESGQSGGNATT
jgi:hypothetical protein